MTTKFCPECGHEHDADAKFCPECGAALGEAGAEQRLEGEGIAEGTDPTTVAAITHLLGLFTWVVGPVVVLMVTEDEFVEANARTALNWQLMFTLYMVVAAVLTVVLIGVLFLFVLPLLDMVFCVVAAVKATEGETWTYPFTPDLV